MGGFINNKEDLEKILESIIKYIEICEDTEIEENYNLSEGGTD